jgi:hypothetical protein
MAKSSFGAKKSGGAVDLDREIAVVGTLAYPYFAVPDEQSGKYSCILIVENDESTLAELRELVADHAEALCGNRELNAKHIDPIRDGDEPGTNGGYAQKHPSFRGQTFFRAKSNYQPKCFEGEARTPVDVTEIRGGDKVIQAVKAYHFNNQSAGVSLSLNGVWRIAKGNVIIERGGGGGSSFSRFDAGKVKFSRGSGEF